MIEDCYITKRKYIGLTQNHEKTNREVRKEHEVKRVWESYRVSPGIFETLTNDK